MVRHASWPSQASSASARSAQSTKFHHPNFEHLLHRPVGKVSEAEQRSIKEVSAELEVHAAFLGPGSKFVLREGNISRSIWNLVIALLLVYTATVFPFRLCFIEFRILRPQTNISDRWLLLEQGVDILFIIDLVLNFFFSFTNKENCEIISLPHIASRYFRTYFLINFVSCIPMPLIRAFLQLFGEDRQGTTANRALRLGNMHRISRLARLLRITRVAKILQLLQLSSKVRWFESLRGVRVISFVIRLFWIVHLLACGWYLCSSLNPWPNNTWVGQRKFFVNGGATSLAEATAGDQWLTSMYFVLTVFTTVGFGDIGPVTIYEMLYCCFTMIVGAVVNSIVLGEIMKTITSLSNERQEIEKAKDMFITFARHTELGHEFTDTIVKWAVGSSRKIEHGTEEGLHRMLTGSYLPQSILTKLPNLVFHGQLMYSMFLTQHMRAAQVIPPRLPILVAMYCHRSCFESGEYVFYCHDYPWSIFLVVDGTFAYVATPDKRGGIPEQLPGIKLADSWTPGSHLIIEDGGETNSGLSPYQLFGQGNYFGDLEIFAGKPRRSAARCEADGSVLLLHKQDLKRLSEDFPTFASVWKFNAINRDQHRKRLLRQLTCNMNYQELAVCTIQQRIRRSVNSVADYPEVSKKWAVIGSGGANAQGRKSFKQQVISRLETLEERVNSHHDEIQKTLQLITEQITREPQYFMHPAPEGGQGRVCRPITLQTQCL